MAITPRQPQPDDAVLGGQSLAPLDESVLGGIEGVKKHFSQLYGKMMGATEILDPQAALSRLL